MKRGVKTGMGRQRRYMRKPTLTSTFTFLHLYLDPIHLRTLTSTSLDIYGNIISLHIDQHNNILHSGANIGYN